MPLRIPLVEMKQDLRDAFNKERNRPTGTGDQVNVLRLPGNTELDLVVL